MKYIIPTSLCLAALLVIAPSAARAEMDITGVWKTIDTGTGKALSHVKIWEKDGVYYGKIDYLLDASRGSRCTACTGAMKNRPVTGMVMLWGMKKSADKDGGFAYYTGGRILDTGNGRDYPCSMWLVGDNKIRVRSYLFLFHRTRYWYRVR